MSAIAGINGDVWFSASPSTALASPESAADSGNHKNYFLTHQAWDESQTFTVECSPDGSTDWAVETDYEIYWPVGEIIFDTTRTVGTNDHVRVSAGHYFPLSSLSGAHAWKASAKAMTKDTTLFQAEDHFAQNTATMKSMTFSVDCFSDDARILNELVMGDDAINISGGVVICQLWWDKPGGKRWQFAAIPTGMDTTVAANDVDKQSINMTVTGPLYRITSDTLSTTTVSRA